MGASDRDARTRSDFRPRRRCQRDTFPNLHLPSHLPHYRQQSRRENKPPKSNRGWSRVPHQSARHGYRRRGVPAKMARAPLVEKDHQGAYRLGGDRRRRGARAANETALLFEWGRRDIPPEMRRPPQRPNRPQQSQRSNNGVQTQPRRASRVPHQLARHGYRTQDPPVCTAMIRLVGKEARGRYLKRGNGRRRSRRLNSIDLPPPGAGVGELSFQICAARRSSPTTASSRDETIKPLKRNRGWRREFRISRRSMVIDAAAPSKNSRGDRNAADRRMGMRGIPQRCAGRRSAHIAASSRRGAIATPIRFGDGRRDFRNS